MKESQIKSILDALSKVINITDSAKQSYLERYLFMNDKDIIKDLALIIYKELYNQNDLYDYFLDLIRNINLEEYSSIEDIKKEINASVNNENPDTVLEENHSFVLESINFFTRLFNNNSIDYYVTGIVPVLVKNNIPLYRYHDNINFMINENDIERVKELMEECGYYFYDDRFISEDRYIVLKDNPLQTSLTAQNPYNTFKFCFSVFKRQDDKIELIDYKHRLNNNEVITDMIIKEVSSVGQMVQYTNDETYNNTHFKSNSVESIYESKINSKKPKDIKDIKMISSLVDSEKLKVLRQNVNKKTIIKDISKPKEL